MKNKLPRLFVLTCVFLFFFCIGFSVCILANKENKLLRSSGTLFITSNEDKGLGVCTTVAFAKNEKKYLFFTAAHCVAHYNPETRETVAKNAGLHIILVNQSSDVLAYKAAILQSKEKGLAIGRLKDFEDFAILEAEISQDVPIIPLSKFRPELLERVSILTPPSKSTSDRRPLRGYVNVAKMDNRIIIKNIKTIGAFGVKVYGLEYPSGSSGGGVLSIEQDAIVGIVTASTFDSEDEDEDKITLLISPITKFNAFYKEYMEGKRLSPK